VRPWLARLLLAGALALGSPLAAEAGGAIYSYTDGNGITHFTNVPRGDGRYKPMDKRAVRRRSYPAPKRDDYDALIQTIAADYGIPPALVKAVIAAESAFNPLAVSRAGAQGLMQLMPSTAAAVGVSDSLVPEQNVRGGVTYLRLMIERYGDLSRALAAYNAGPAAVDRYGGIPPYRETKDYVARVLSYYRQYDGDITR
jgi:soluble lytic murein transglycosylase-like protein